VSAPLIVDANPLMSALLGGAAERIIATGRFKLYSSQYTLFEVAKHLPRLAELLECPELQLFEVFERLPVEACQPSVYAEQESHAMALIGSRDDRDVPLLALTLAYGYPLWSDDRDFEGIDRIQLVKTADLLSLLSSPAHE
jgi:predicted nucleic acid-binding protein